MEIRDFHSVSFDELLTRHFVQGSWEKTAHVSLHQIQHSLTVLLSDLARVFVSAAKLKRASGVSF